MPQPPDIHIRRLRLAETIKFGGNPPDVWPQVNAAATEAEGDNPSQEPYSGAPRLNLCMQQQGTTLIRHARLTWGMQQSLLYLLLQRTGLRPQPSIACS